MPKRYLLTLLAASIVAGIPAIAENVITKDGLIAMDPHWGTEEVKKIDRCLQLPKPLSRAGIGKAAIGVRFVIDGKGTISRLKPDPYYAQSGIPKSTFTAVQGAIIDAIKRSHVRAPKLADPPFHALFYVAGEKSELSLSAPPPERHR